MKGPISWKYTLVLIILFAQLALKTSLPDHLLSDGSLHPETKPIYIEVANLIVNTDHTLRTVARKTELPHFA